MASIICPEFVSILVWREVDSTSTHKRQQLSRRPQNTLLQFDWIYNLKLKCWSLNEGRIKINITGHYRWIETQISATTSLVPFSVHLLWIINKKLNFRFINLFENKFSALINCFYYFLVLTLNFLLPLLSSHHQQVQSLQKKQGNIKNIKLKVKTSKNVHLPLSSKPVQNIL